jgi:hypothetical protein
MRPPIGIDRQPQCRRYEWPAHCEREQAGGKMAGKRLVRRASACLFLLFISSVYFFCLFLLFISSVYFFCPFLVASWSHPALKEQEIISPKPKRFVSVGRTSRVRSTPYVNRSAAGASDHGRRMQDQRNPGLCHSLLARHRHQTNSAGRRERLHSTSRDCFGSARRGKKFDQSFRAFKHSGAGHDGGHASGELRGNRLRPSTL